ncbi:MAG: PEP-CTERM sorting domain-containing protein [Phycisphaerales bacterium]|nr:PEP-CTERM sorting domain-containing protein [Planctomycetota bacterium]MCH8507161.1 PEP-CTERM sorting domain-containing protein [Phycisphaerales bacterium]
MKSKISMCCAGLIAASAGLASADVLWDNGSMVTHAGAGAGGADVSMASAVPNTAGSNVTASLLRGDDFSVGGPGWIISNIQMFAYDTNNANPRWSDAQISIRENNGGSVGDVVASAAATWEYSGINRVFNGEANLSNTARQIQTLTADFGGLVLGAGDYWVTIGITNTAGVNSWMSFVMDNNPDDANNPITRVGNSIISTNSGETWAAGNVTTGDWNQSPELPFLINGTIVPAPGAMALLGLGGLMAGRRRRA